MIVLSYSHVQKDVRAKTAVPISGLAVQIGSMGLAQLVLTLLTVTTYHIQIITRISSGYPLWYIWLAESLSDKVRAEPAGKIVVFMVMYASIQGALFASFLPPA